MKNLSLSMKLNGGFIIVALITIIVGIIGWRGISATGSALTEVGFVRLPSLYGLEIMNEAQTSIQRAELCLLIPEIFGEKKEFDHQIKGLGDDWQRVDQGLKIYEPLPQSKDETVLWNKFKPTWETWKKEHQQVIALLKSGKREEAFALSTGKATESFKAAEALLNDLVELQNRESASFIKESVGDVDRPKIVMGIAMGVGTLMAIFLGTFLSLSITRTLNRIISGLTEASDQVSSAAGEVSSASQSLAEGASQQAASVEETSSSLEEMSSMTKQNASNAGQADSLMKQANQVVNKANTSMGQLTTSMQEISKASEETSKIIKTIDEIAFQTNLLALNAAVEAARAGEAGAGFAVVADEVRNLAMRAADAAKNTAALIEGTVKKVTDGTALVKTTNDAFKEVAATTVKVGELVGEIAAASSEQSQGIEQVNIAVTEMDKVTQQNAATAEESASASEELNAQAEELKAFVADLAAMVGGHTVVSTGGSRTHKRSKAAVPARPVPQKALTLAKKSAKGRALTLPRPRQVNPDDIIPMDENDFKDF